MAGYVPNQFRAVLLEALAGRTAIAAAPVYLGLATSIPDNPLEATLANITEVTTTGYARKAVPAFDAATIPTTGTSGTVQITVPTEFLFDALTEDMLTDAPYAFLTTAAAGTVDPIRYIFLLAESVLAAAADPIKVPANTLVIE